MFRWICNIFTKSKDPDSVGELQEGHYSDFDYECLVELYYKNNWLRHQVNIKGLENLWFDFNDNYDKKILLKLLNNFTYLTQEDAELEIKKRLYSTINELSLKPSNTLFIGFQKHKYPDGSQVLLNFIKGILVENDPNWKEHNLLPNFHYGIGRIKVDGFPNQGVHLKNIVLVDDFIGTGGTAYTNVSHINDILTKEEKEFTLSLFSIATMKAGVSKLKPLKFRLDTCYVLDKATNVIWPKWTRTKMRGRIKNMEDILYHGKEPETLEKFSLGYGKSEALYSLNRFNLPNNNLPIFWWNRYRNGKNRKPLFNRMQ